MDTRTVLAALLMVSVALAGCSGDKDKGPSPAELCEGIWHAEEGQCDPHVEPRVVISDLPSEVVAYKTTSYTWALDNGTRGEAGNPVHSMDSRILAVTDGSQPTNTTLPDGFGIELAKAEHKNLPDNFSATLRWDTPGDVLALWGYMRIDGVHTWNLVQNVTVVQPSPTGAQKTVTISGTPPAPDNTDLSGVVGDGLVFDNQNALYGYEISFECNNGVSVSSISLGADSTSTPVVFLKPTSCSWTAESPATEADLGNLSGSYRANAE